MPDPNRPPLWEVMARVSHDWNHLDKAAELRAIAEAIPEEFYGAGGVRRWLLEEANRAEAGE